MDSLVNIWDKVTSKAEIEWPLEVEGGLVTTKSNPLARTRK